MPIISHMGVDYDSPNIQIQDNASATDLDNTKIPTGQTIEGYINDRFFYKQVTGTTNSNGFLNMGVTADQGVLISCIVLSADMGYLAVPYRHSTSSNSTQSAFVFSYMFNRLNSYNVTVLGVFAKGLQAKS